MREDLGSILGHLHAKDENSAYSKSQLKVATNRQRAKIQNLTLSINQQCKERVRRKEQSYEEMERVIRVLEGALRKI